MNFREVLPALISEFEKEKTGYALIGGFSLHFWGYSRSTGDLDFIVLGEQRDIMGKIMGALGFKEFAETEHVAHFETEGGRIDLIFAHSVHGRRIIERACEMDYFGLKLKVARAEDIIGLKVQSLANNPMRWLKEMADIESLLFENRGKLDLELIGDYFRLFGKEGDWEGILERYHASER